MTKEEMNQVIKDAMVRNLRKETDIPDDIGSKYKNWVLGKVQLANAQLKEQATQQAQAQTQEQGEENGRT